MTRFISRQLTQSTADDARDYFTGSFQPVGPPVTPVLPPGIYRVVDGALRRVVEGLPPALAETATDPGQDHTAEP